MLNPDGIFSLAGPATRYTVRHERASRGAQPDEIKIIYFRWYKFGHFAAGVSEAAACDTLGVSNAVKRGTLHRYFAYCRLCHC